MVDLGRLEYAGPPRTGTSWILMAAARCGLPVGSAKATVHLPHAGPHSGKIRVATVRHPCAWLASYWQVIYPGHVGVEQVDQFADLPGESFDEFVQSYLRQIPGAVGRMFAAYGADTCLRVEDLPRGWVELLRSLRVPRAFTERCMAMGRANASLRPVPIWLGTLRRAVCEAEVDTLESFDYWE